MLDKKIITLIKVFLLITCAYISSYFVRDTIKVISEILIDKRYFSDWKLFSKTLTWDPIISYGLIITITGITYGFGKFFLGIVTDRIGARLMLAFSLIMSSILFPLSVWSLASKKLILILIISASFGLVQGGANPACYKILANWISIKVRGKYASLWNISHNIGTIIAPLTLIFGFFIFGKQQVMKAIIIPAILTFCFGIIVWFFLKEKPKIVKIKKKEYLPKINYSKKQIFKNRYLWYIFIANIFCYVIRYAPLIWIASYAKTKWGYDFSKQKNFFIIFELMAIPGTIIFGFAADRVFQKRRARLLLLSLLMLTPGLLFLVFYPSSPMLVMIAIINIGFFIYNSINLHSVMIIDVVPKNMIGTFVGLNGLFGYIGASILGGIVLSALITKWGYICFSILMIISWLISIFMMYLCRNLSVNNKKFT